MLIYNNTLRGKECVMIKSMTGFGRGESARGGLHIVCEIKTVNGKYLDVSARLPRRFSFFEPSVKGLLSYNGITRGKADVTFEVAFEGAAASHISVNTDLAEQYLTALNSLADELSLPHVTDVREIASKPDVLAVVDAEIDGNVFSQAAEEALKAAAVQVCTMREAEGEKLLSDFFSKLSLCEELVTEVEKLSENSQKGYYSRLEARLKKALEDYRITPDESRMLTECAIFADKVAVDEETVRLRSHFKAFREITRSGEPCGRRLDFLVQEMNREVNTIGSKCSDSDVAHKIVSLKNEIEKIREQIQNIE